MPKPLSELTQAELWALFPIIIAPSDPGYPAVYVRQAAAVTAIVGAANIYRLSHIGSTAVPGLDAKPTIDMLLEINPDCEVEEFTKRLVRQGWIADPQPGKPPPHLVFYYGYTPEGYAGEVFHLHVRYPGDWGELYFRDYLRSSPEACRRYAELKHDLAGQFKHDRDGYTAAKGRFVEEITELARRTFPARYQKN